MLVEKFLDGLSEFFSSSRWMMVLEIVSNNNSFRQPDFDSPDRGDYARILHANRNVASSSRIVAWFDVFDIEDHIHFLE